MNKYTKYMALLSAAIVATGCSTTEDAPESPSAGISDTPVAIAVTTGDEFLNGDGVRSRASFHTSTLSEITIMTTSGAGRYFNSLVVRRNGVWTTMDGFSNTPRTYYWPWSGMDVYAVAGNMGQTDNWLINNNSSVTFGNSGGHACPVSFAYTVNRNNPVNDPLYAAKVDCDRYSGTNKNGTVELNFRHLLSRLTFAVVNDNDDNDVDIHINRIAFDNIMTSGTYQPKPRVTTGVSTSVDATYGTWTGYGNKGNCSTYEQLGNHFALHTTDATAVAVTKPGSATEPYELLLLPQTLNDQTRLAVEYSITRKWDNGIIRDMSFQSIDVSNYEWKQNTQYIYRLHFDKVITQVEILPVAFDVNPFIYGGDITPPVN